MGKPEEKRPTGRPRVPWYVDSTGIDLVRTVTGMGLL
jgi:hypothetical protein